MSKKTASPADHAALLATALSGLELSYPEGLEPLHRHFKQITGLQKALETRTFGEVRGAYQDCQAGQYRAKRAKDTKSVEVLQATEKLLEAQLEDLHAQLRAVGHYQDELRTELHARYFASRATGTKIALTRITLVHAESLDMLSLVVEGGDTPVTFSFEFKGISFTGTGKDLVYWAAEHKIGIDVTYLAAEEFTGSYNEYPAWAAKQGLPRDDEDLVEIAV